MKTVLLVLSIGILAAGCICHPGGRITVNLGWRSAQCGAATNIVNGIEGGGNPTLSLPVK